MTTLNRKADLLLLITCWIFFIRSIAGLKLNRLIIDSPVKNGSSIWLRCDFQLDDAERRAFTSKFYKNNIEFYRYSITGDRPRPAKKYFVQLAVHVNINKSNGSHVYIENVEPLTEGTYSCEINTDEPFFMSMQAQQDLRVYVLPKNGLQLINVRENYKDGDFVNIQCRSSASKPSMVLRWHINGQQITKDEENLNLTYQTLDQDSINGLSYTSSNLTFYLCANTSSVAAAHNAIVSYPARANGKARRLPCARRGRIGQLLRQHNGALYIRCTGVLSQIMDETSEELIFEEKGQSVRTEQSGNLESLKPPKIQGTANMRYQIGDQLQLNCSSGGHSLPAAFLEWFVNNRRINEQFVHNYADGQQAVSSPIFGESNGRSPKGRTPNFDVQQMPESNFHSSSLSKSSASPKAPHLASRSQRKTAKKNENRPADELTTATTDKTKIEFQNDYLFSNYLKKLNLLSLQQRNKNSNLSLSSLLQSDNNLTLAALFGQAANSSEAAGGQLNLYNNNVNLTRLQNTIYQHYADYSLKPAQQRTHNIGIRFRVMKKHYQTLDFALRVKCVATYGKIIAQDQSTIALFADGRASQYFNALEISAATTCYSSAIPVLLVSIVRLISLINRGFIND